MAQTLTRARVVDILHDRVGLTKKEAGDLLEETLEIMCDALCTGEQVKVSGFGNWQVRDKGARPGRNPQTSQPIIIARRRVVTFKPSQVLRNALNTDQ